MTPELLIVLVGGAAGAALGGLLRLPMWPITGATLGAAAANIAVASTVAVPPGIGFVAQVLVGTAVGASVLPGFAAQLGRLIVPAVVVVLALVAAGLSAAALLSGFGFAGQSEALLGMLPGGVGEMVAASAALGSDSAVVAGLHFVRLLLTLWTLPLLVRWARTWRRRDEPDASPASGEAIG